MPSNSLFGNTDPLESTAAPLERYNKFPPRISLGGDSTASYNPHRAPSSRGSKDNPDRAPSSRGSKDNPHRAPSSRGSKDNPYRAPSSRGSKDSEPKARVWHQDSKPGTQGTHEELYLRVEEVASSPLASCPGGVSLTELEALLQGSRGEVFYHWIKSRYHYVYKLSELNGVVYLEKSELFKAIESFIQDCILTGEGLTTISRAKYENLNLTITLTLI